MKKILAVIALAMMAFAVQAAELSLKQEGRVEVARCYADCVMAGDDLSTEIADIYVALVGQTLEFLGRALRSGVDLDLTGQDEVADFAQCEFAQIRMNAADTCSASCRDLEAVYGTTSSWAKTRAVYRFNTFKASLVQSELWTSYLDYPGRGTYDFALACEQYLGN